MYYIMTLPVFRKINKNTVRASYAMVTINVLRYDAIPTSTFINEWTLRNVEYQ